MTKELPEMGHPSYLAQVKLWNITAGEDAAELLYTSETFRIMPLTELRHVWPDYLHKAFKAAKIPQAEIARVEGVNPGSLRVTLSRSNGVGIQRRRFKWRTREYMVSLHVEREDAVNVLAKLATMVKAPGRRPTEITFWYTGSGDWASVEYDPNISGAMIDNEFIASHPVTGDAVVAKATDSKTPKKGRTAILYSLEPM